jgi:hypothetical protein
MLEKVHVVKKTHSFLLLKKVSRIVKKWACLERKWFTVQKVFAYNKNTSKYVCASLRVDTCFKKLFYENFTMNRALV